MSAHLTFTAPSPFGLEPRTDFTLTDVEASTGLYALTAEREEGIRLYVLDAAAYLADYSPVITDEQCAELGVTKPEEVLLLVVANPGDGGVTVNLLAPIVVNANTGVAAQVILEGDEWPLRAQLAARAA